MLLAKECFLKSFDTLKEDRRNFHYSKIEILKDYCKLLVALGEIRAAEINYVFLIQHCFLYYGSLSEYSINVLMDYIEFKILTAHNETALGYMEYANSLLNLMKFFKKSSCKRDFQFKVKSNLFLLCNVFGYQYRIKTILNSLYILHKQLKIYEVKDILSVITGKETEEQLKEIEEYITYNILRSKYLQTISQNKEAQAVLERNAIICKKNPKRFSKQLIEINVELMAIFKQTQSNEYKLLQLIDESLKLLKNLKENTLETVITIMNFCEILISLNHLNKTLELINQIEKMLHTFLGKYDDTFYSARLNLLLGAYNFRKSDLETAEKYYNKSMETFDKVLGDNNYSLMIKCELADLYVKRENEKIPKQSEEENSNTKVVRVDLNEDKKGSSMKKTNK